MVPVPNQHGRFHLEPVVVTSGKSGKTIRGPMEPAFFNDPATWQPVLRHLERLVSEQTQHGMTIERLTQNIREGTHRVWIWGDFEAVFITTYFRQANGRPTLSLSWAVGDDAIHPDEIYPAIEAYARTQGCQAILIVGRKGWERVMRPHGFVLADQTIWKELQDVDRR